MQVGVTGRQEADSDCFDLASRYAAYAGERIDLNRQVRYECLEDRTLVFGADGPTLLLAFKGLPDSLRLANITYKAVPRASDAPGVPTPPTGVAASSGMRWSGGAGRGWLAAGVALLLVSSSFLRNPHFVGPPRWPCG